MRRVSVLVSVAAIVLVGLLASGRLATDAAQEGTPGAGQAAAVAVTLRDANGQEAGSATFTEGTDGAVTVSVSVQGLTPGEHGIHVHAVGRCEPTGEMPFASAGGHYNPTGAAHDGPPSMTGGMAMGTPSAMGTPGVAAGHAGDLGNITADASGAARLDITSDRFTLSPGPTSLEDADGSALVIHANPDDLVTDPSGNSGGRVVCGIVVPAPGGTPVAATPAP